jgi:hypothetical protein
MTNKLTTADLLALIGQQVTYQQHQCEIVELLDSSVLVLQVVAQVAHQDDDYQIQPTQHGEGHREVPMTFTLDVFDVDGEPHPELIALNLF